MAEGLNKTMIIGNLGQDPELKVLPSGDSVLDLRVAATETYKDKNGEKKESTEWFSVSIFGKRAEWLARILNKGDRIYVEGSLKTTSTEKDGVKRYFTKLNARNVILLGGKRPDTGDAPTGGEGPDLGDDEVPF